jgi:hypothetical protein
MSRRTILAYLGGLAVLVGCGLPTRQDVDLAQTVNDMGQAMMDLQAGQEELSARVDSLASLVARQDSTLRSMANLMGAPLPPR